MPVNAVIELAVHMHQFVNLGLAEKGFVVMNRPVHGYTMLQSSLFLRVWG